MRRALAALLILLVVAPTPAGADDAKASGALERCLSKHVRALVSLARKSKKKDPDVAERALRIVLAIDPEHKDAEPMLREMGRWGRLVVLFSGADMAAWHHADPPQWRVEGREIRGNCKDAAYLMRTLETFEGSYSVKMEARFIRANSTSATLFAIGGDADDGEARVEMGLLRGLPYFKRKSDESSETLHKGSLDDVDPRLDPQEWNTYELEFTPSSVIARINDQEIARAPRGSGSGGYISMVVQECEFAIRRVEARAYE
jgi:hypothetical protein